MNEVTNQIEGKKPRSKFKKVLILLLILLLLCAVGYGVYYFMNNKTSPKKEANQKTFSGELAPLEAKTDSSRTITKTFSSAGGVMSIESAEGTLYTLTVPVEALILPSTVTMTPLTENPIANYGTSADKGVSLSGKFSFIRPVYLTIQPNTKKPTEKIKFNYCAVGSYGYDPEVCAGVAGIPFGAGVAPGKVMVFADTKRDEVLLQPTVYTGMKNTTNGIVYYPGSYFADQVNKNQLTDLAKKTFDGSNDYINQTEVLTHLIAFGGDLTPFKYEIERFARQKGDYPREVLKGAIIALAYGDKTIAAKRTEEYKVRITQKSKDIRSSFLPWTRYAAITNQIKAQKNKNHEPAKKSGLIEKVYAELPDYDPSGSNNGGDASGLPDYQGDNGVDYHNGGDSSSWSDIWNDLFPSSDDPAPDDGDVDPNLRDWSDTEAEDADQQNADDEIEQGCRNTINDANATACEKAQAIRTLITMGKVTGADVPSYSSILEQCSQQCTTMGECEDTGDIGEKWGLTEVVNFANNRIILFLKEAENCDLAHKQGLADFGNNMCVNPAE